MSAAGLSITNSSGTTLIDTTSPVLTLIYKGPFSGIPTSGRVAGLDAVDTAGTTFYSFDVDPGPPSNFGLVLYDANGNIMFDAAHKPARWLDSWGGADVSSGLGTRTYPSNLTLALYYPRSGRHTVITTGKLGSETQSYVLTYEVQASWSGNTLTFASNKTDDETVDGGLIAGTYDTCPWSAIVLDVTGY